MDFDYICLRIDSPIRPPDWRTRQARRLHEYRLQYISTRQRDVPDEIVRQLLVFQYGWTWSPPRPEERPAIQAAQRFRETASAWDLLTVQLRLLARESDEEIGRRVGQPPDVIHFYEKLYYHCRDRLHGQSYIRNHFFALPHVDPTLADVLRRCAYWGGPHTLDRVLSVVRDDEAGVVLP